MTRRFWRIERYDALEHLLREHRVVRRRSRPRRSPPRETAGEMVMSLNFTCHVLLVGVYFLQIPCFVAAGYRAGLERHAPGFLHRCIDSVAHG